MTDAEKLLWKHLRGKKLDGAYFRRQHQVGKYFADFVCIEHKLIIELDGGQHATQQSYDKTRDNFIKEQGFIVLRFWNNEVMENIEAVAMKILGCIKNPN